MLGSNTDTDKQANNLIQQARILGASDSEILQALTSKEGSNNDSRMIIGLLKLIASYTSSGGATDEQVASAVNKYLTDNPVQAYDDSEIKGEIGELKGEVDTLNQGGLNLKEGFIDQQVNEWLDEHPEATTTVQDASLEVIKFTEDAKKYVVKDYVTPEMFGAVGDGITDDTKAIQNALNSGNKRVVLKNKTYKITQTLVMPSFTVLEGVTSNYEGSTIKNVLCDAISFTENSRFAQVKNLSLMGDMTHAGIVFTTTKGEESTITRTVIEHVTINNQKYGITDSFVDDVFIESTNLTLWDCTFADIRSYYTSDEPEYGIYLSNQTTGFNLLFQQCYPIGKIYLHNVNCTCLNCNFSVGSERSITMTPSCSLNFIGCNFECDNKPITNKSPLMANAFRINFTQCIFHTKTNENTTSKFFNFGSSTKGVVFNNCEFKIVGDSENNFWDDIGPGTDLNSLYFIGYNNIKPNYSGSVYSAVVSDFGKVPVIEYNTSPKSAGKGYIGTLYGNSGTIVVSDGEKWVSQGVICSSNEPTFAINSGSLWYDTLNKKLKVYYNETWNEV